ncbi:MAG: hypothetical protein H0W21_12985 [Actinobacteria bacterium]|nr:hypothetical protein [Actinomycetota bacterium]
MQVNSLKLFGPRLLLAGSLVLVVVGAALFLRTDDKVETATPRQIRGYEFVGRGQLMGAVRRENEALIIRGEVSTARFEGLRRANPGLRFVNYEQAFALNVSEAGYARDRGWLATTCDGKEIHPANIPNVTLLDATIRTSLVWRTDLIASETRRGYDLNYLDTLRSFFPPNFYDELPCDVSDIEWLDASLETVELVRSKSGKPVIVNGSGLGSGRSYLEHKEEADRLVASADGVQIEHFLRSPNEEDEDIDLVEAINAAGKDAYVKCARSREACRSAFAKAGSLQRNYLHIRR